MAGEYGRWEPITVKEVAEAMRGFGRPWWIAGGFALEAFAGRRWREHDDIDIAVFCEDHEAVHEHLGQWELHAAWPPGTLRPWEPGVTLPASVHDIWARRREGEPWAFQFMLDERDGGDWVFRRDATVRLPVGELTWEREGVRYLRPDVQLLYKARGARPKDEHDFAEVAPLLDLTARQWLRAQLAKLHPEHAWLAALAPERSG